MWPWGHLALGILAFVLLAWRRGGRPRNAVLVPLAIGAQFPDLLDKPLAYSVGVLPEGRSLFHSVLLVVPLCLLAVALARRYAVADAGTAFAVGYASHPVGDAIGPLLAGRPAELSFLVWPLLPAPDYEAASFAHHADQLAAALSELTVEHLLTGWADPFVVQLWLALLAGLLWLAAGPGPPDPARE